MSNSIFEKIQTYLEKREQELERIPKARKELLQQLSTYCNKKIKAEKTPQVVVICTHNSRRSHFGQLWLAVVADYLNFPIATFSGGTEATAFNPRAIAALKKVGFEIAIKNTHSNNPTYFIKWKQEMPPYAAFSKKYGDTPNPNKEFAAVMVCSEADEGCPLVLGADFRLALPFDDPKMYDETDLESEKYEERCADIAREMLLVIRELEN